MSAFEAVVGPVDRLRGKTLPDQLHLNAIVLLKPPGADGIDYQEADVISDGVTPVSFTVDNSRLMSLSPVSITMKTGSWARAFMVLLDEAGEPYAFGALRSADGAPVCGILEAGKNKITVRNHPRA
ncbi:hypothetical protein [Brevundimonas sp. TWP2-3-2]|uniref:hypothetical protein n=1 Tax=unclassified Brevundimonas TaxID=2622653 RepID=UPI003CECE614